MDRYRTKISDKTFNVKTFRGFYQSLYLVIFILKKIFQLPFNCKMYIILFNLFSI